MGFLHLGWEVATRIDGDLTVVQEESPAWAAAARKIDLTRPGLVLTAPSLQGILMALACKLPDWHQAAAEHRCSLGSTAWVSLLLAVLVSACRAVCKQCVLSITSSNTT